MLQEAGHIKNTVVLIFKHIQCLHLMYSEVVWVLIYSRTQVQPQIILDQDYLPDYLSFSYDYDILHIKFAFHNGVNEVFRSYGLGDTAKHLLKNQF